MINPIKITKTGGIDSYLKYYGKIIENPEVEPEQWSIILLSDYLKQNNLPTDEESVKQYKLANAKRLVYRTNNKSFDKVRFDTPIARFISPQGLEYIWWEGKQMLFLSDYIEEYVGDLWTDISTINLNKEGGVDLSNGKKPEKLMERVIALSTKEGDVVLDFCLGSGTTSAVAHKMNRRWIGVEQMDYIDTLAKVRLNKVLEGEQGGISKSVNWQGGGSFIYLELKKYNQEYIDRILVATSLAELEVVYEEMRQNAFLKFFFDKDDFEQFTDFRDRVAGKKGKELQELLDKRKDALISILDENQLYLNYADMNDARHKVSADEKALTNKFYGENSNN